MPDDNKFAKLKEMGFTVKPCCLLCEHGHEFGHFPSQGKLWGRCSHPENAYEHGKHTGTMELGVLCVAVCSRFKPYEARLFHWAGSYGEFFDGGPGETNGS